MVSVIYLYKTHDADLIGLLEEVGIKDFREVMKDALRILTRPGYIPKINIPTYKTYDGDTDFFKIAISIQSKKDIDIQELLNHVKNRRINSFIKMAMRFYLGVIPTMSSMLDTELIKTVPVYTPSGVIVFSNNINTGINEKQKEQKRIKKENIKRANKTIQIKSKENIEPLNFIDTNNTSIEENNDISFENVSTDIDVLALLDKIM